MYIYAITYVISILLQTFEIHNVRGFSSPIMSHVTKSKSNQIKTLPQLSNIYVFSFDMTCLPFYYPPPPPPTTRAQKHQQS